MEIIIILFVIYGIVSSISKKRNEERKRQQQQTKQRLENAYPPNTWPRREPPQMPFAHQDVPQQVNYEPQPELYEPAQSPWPPEDKYDPAPQETAAPSQALYEKFFDAVDNWMGGHMPFNAEPAPAKREESAPFAPAQSVADKLKREAEAGEGKGMSEPAFPPQRHAAGFMQGQSRNDIINGVIWSEILTRPSARSRRRAF